VERSLSRPLPWTELVSAIGVEQFVRIQVSLEARHADDLDRDAFLLDGMVGTLLKDLMPEDAPADAVSAWAALLHMMYLCWVRDWPLVVVDAPTLDAALSGPLAHSSTRPLLEGHTPPLACYAQLPANAVWAEPVEGETHEPLDGIFLVASAARAHALGVLGFREGRDGFTTMEGAITLPAPAPGPRPDASPAFATRLPGGDLARLRSVVDEHELVALALLAVAAASRQDT
jgi:hypothetical protein